MKAIREIKIFAQWTDEEEKEVAIRMNAYPYFGEIYGPNVVFIGPDPTGQRKQVLWMNPYAAGEMVRCCQVRMNCHVCGMITTWFVTVQHDATLKDVTIAYCSDHDPKGERRDDV